MLKIENSIVRKTTMLTGQSKERLIFGICLICIFLFLYTGYSKILQHTRFTEGLARIKSIGSLAVYIAWFVPITEIFIAILLIIPKTYKWGLNAFVGIMTVFTGYIISMLLWAEKLPCRCGGAIEKLSWTQHIWFNLAFIAIAVFALWLSKSNINH
jgi:uncharacterized membrane protein YphA (DoxX/SURF4 family)